MELGTYLSLKVAGVLRVELLPITWLFTGDAARSRDYEVCKNVLAQQSFGVEILFSQEVADLLSKHPGRLRVSLQGQYTQLYVPPFPPTDMPKALKE